MNNLWGVVKLHTDSIAYERNLQKFFSNLRRAGEIPAPTVNFKNVFVLKQSPDEKRCLKRYF